MDYYELLGVSRNASTEAIKRAFHSRVRVTHPDVNQGSAHASQETRRLIEAYRTLSDPRARRRYDLFTTPTTPDIPIVVPTIYVIDRPAATQRNRLWLFAILIVTLMAILVYHQIESESRMVFRPFLVNGELPSLISTKQFPVVVEPSPSSPVEWYHTQKYQLSMADPWATEQMVHVYERAVERALSEGDAVRVQFYKSAIDNVSRLYL